MKLRRRSLFGTLAAFVAAPVALDLAPPPEPPLGTHVGFYGADPVQIPAAASARDGNEALADLLTDLKALGLIA